VPPPLARSSLIAIPAAVRAATLRATSKPDASADFLVTDDAPAPNAQVATGVDADALMAYFLDRIAAY
jgi:hypothetical protein